MAPREIRITPMNAIMTLTIDPVVILSMGKRIPPSSTVSIGPQLRKMETTETGKAFNDIYTRTETTRMCPIAINHFHRLTVLQDISKLCFSRSR